MDEAGEAGTAGAAGGRDGATGARKRRRGEGEGEDNDGEGADDAVAACLTTGSCRTEGVVAGQRGLTWHESRLPASAPVRR